MDTTPKMEICNIMRGGLYITWKLVVDSHSTTDPTPIMPRIRRDGKNVRGITHAHMCRKDDFFGKYDQTLVQWGEELHLEECNWPKLTKSWFCLFYILHTDPERSLGWFFVTNRTDGDS